MADTSPLETKAVEILDKVTVALADAAKPAAEAVMTGVWFEGVAGLLSGGAYAAIAAVALKCMLPCFRMCSAEAAKDICDQNLPKMFGGGFGGAIIALMAFGFTMASGSYLLNAYVWAALFNPPAAIAIKIMNSLGH